MKRILVILFVLAALAGCATASLPSGATQAEKYAAYCADARQACALAEIAIATATTAEQQQYWTKYLVGAEKAIDLYCGGEK
jgi:uncharacterized protein YceK